VATDRRGQLDTHGTVSVKCKVCGEDKKFFDGIVSLSGFTCKECNENKKTRKVAGSAPATAAVNASVIHAPAAAASMAAPTSGLRVASSTPVHRPGDVIGGEYRVERVIGQGGFGVVLLVTSRQWEEPIALKTIRDEIIADPKIRTMFRKEAELLLDLPSHPFLARDLFVREMDARLYIAMTFVPPDDFGISSLEQALERRPPDLHQSLRWAIECCHGMEFVNSQGVRCHLDLKPANLLIGPDASIKIADFGLAAALSSATGEPCGTPTHMSPEQFESMAKCDVRSDLYAMGVVLYQMATRGELPFAPAVATPQETWNELRRLHRETAPRAVDGPLGPIIARCLEKDPARRYPDFAALRLDLARILRDRFQDEIHVPEADEVDAVEWSRKGASFLNLGRYEDALACMDKAVELDPDDARGWSNRASALMAHGRLEKALEDFDRAIGLESANATLHSNRGLCLSAMGRHDDAMISHSEAVRLAADDAYVHARRGCSLQKVARMDDAVGAFSEAVRLQPTLGTAWLDMGKTLSAVGRWGEAVRALERAVALLPSDAEIPHFLETARGAVARNLEGVPLGQGSAKSEASPGAVELYQQALRSRDASTSLRLLDRAVADSPGFHEAWSCRGEQLCLLNRPEDALASFDRSLAISPGHPEALLSKAAVLVDLRRVDEAISIYEILAKTRPGDGRVLFGLGKTLDLAGRGPDALVVYEKFVASGGKGTPPEYLEGVGNRIRELRSGVATPLATSCDSGLIADESAIATSVASLEAGLAALGAGDPRKAMTHFEAAIAAFAGNALAWCHKGDCLDALGRTDEALIAYDRAIEIDPEEPVPWINKGTTLAQKARHRDALSCYERAFALEEKENPPDTAPNVTGLIRSFEKPTQLLQVVRMWTITAVNAGDAESLLRSIHARSRIDDWGATAEGVALGSRGPELLSTLGGEGLLLLMNAIVAGGDGPTPAAGLSPQPWHAKGLAEESLGHHAEAVRSFRTCIDCAGSDAKQATLVEDCRARIARIEKSAPADSLAAINAEGLVNEGRQFIREKRFDDALLSFEKAVALAPELIEARYELALVIARAMRTEEALVHLDRVVELDPKHRYAWVQRAHLLRALGRWDEALAALDRQIAIKPDDHDLPFFRVEFLADAGRSDDAIARLKEAKRARLFPVSVDAYRWPGICLRLARSGEGAKAVEIIDLLTEYIPSLELRQFAPGFAEMPFAQGAALESIGRGAEAVRCFREYVDIVERYRKRAESSMVGTPVEFPHEAEARRRLGDSPPSRVEKPIDAPGQVPGVLDAILSKAAALRDARVWRLSAEAAEAAGRNQEALNHIIIALQIDAMNADNWRMKGRLLFKVGRTDEVNDAIARADKLS
jgi:tetratricopeptide (TPR) repeat protein